jgi:hypothetical protein
MVHLTTNLTLKRLVADPRPPPTGTLAQKLVDGTKRHRHWLQQLQGAHEFHLELDNP